MRQTAAAAAKAQQDQGKVRGGEAKEEEGVGAKFRI